jgi:hypothetical protein
MKREKPNNIKISLSRGNRLLIMRVLYNYRAAVAVVLIEHNIGDVAIFVRVIVWTAWFKDSSLLYCIA